MAESKYSPDFTAEELASEEWREIPGFEGVYSVSSLGRLRRDKPSRGTAAGKILRPGSCRGYLFVILCVDGIKTAMRVHAAVVAAFIGPRPEGQDVNHIDGVKANNRVSNLEYLTHADNLRHAENVTHARHVKGERHPNSVLTDDAVLQIRSLYETGQFTMTKLAKMFGITLGSVSYILSRKTWTHI